MKKIITAISIFFSVTAYSQTVIPVTTTVYDFSRMKNGQYMIISPTDTLIATKDTALIITKTVTVTIHDTIPRICPVTVPCPIVDTAAIQALKICPAPIPQRSMVGLSYNPATNQWIVTYQDNSTSIFLPTKTLFIQ